MAPQIQVVPVAPGVKSLRIQGALYDHELEDFFLELADKLGHDLQVDADPEQPRRARAVAPVSHEVQLFGTFAARPTVSGHEVITKAELLSGWCRLINQTKGFSVRAEEAADNGWVAHCLPEDLQIVSGMLPYGGHGLEMQLTMTSENRLAVGGQSPPPPPAGDPPLVVEEGSDERAAAVQRMAAFDTPAQDVGLSFAEARAAARGIAKPPTLIEAAAASVAAAPVPVTQEDKDQLVREATASQLRITRQMLNELTDEERLAFAEALGFTVSSPPTSRSPGESQLPDAAGELPSPGVDAPAAVDHTRSTLPEDPRRVSHAFSTSSNH